MLNKLLQRQVQKHLGGPDQVPENIKALLKVISESYDHFEKDRSMLERSIELSSTEMIGLNDNLRKEKDGLKKAHQELNTLFCNIEEVFFTVDMKAFRLIQMSAACEKIYGYKPEEFFNNNFLWSEIMHPGDSHILETNDIEFKKGKAVVSQYRIIRKDGTERWVESRITPTLNEAGELVRIDGVTNDITEKLIAEQKIRESEMRFRSLIENSDDMLTMVDDTGKVRYESPAIERTLGYTPGENAGRPGHELFHPDDRERTVRIFCRAKENPGVTYFLEVRLLKKDGDYIYAEGNVTSLLDVDGVNAVVSNFRDVTTRVKAEQELRESENRYRLVYENPFFGIALGSLDGIVQDVNAVFCKTLGYEPGEMRNMHFSEFTPPEDVEKEKSFIQKMKNGEVDSYQLEKRYITRSKEIIWVDLNVSCVKNEAGQIQFVIAVTQDITAKRKAEESLQKSEANLRNILENTDTAYVLLDENARILSWNNLAGALALEQKGAMLEEGKNYIDMIEKERREDVRKVISEVLFSGQQVSYETSQAGNRDRWMHISMHPLFSGERVLGLSVAITDITARKQYEQRIRESNERYELVTRATNDIIWDWDITRNKMYRSAMYTQAFGHTCTEGSIYGESWITHIHYDDRGRVLHSIADMIDCPDAILWECEYRFYRQDREMAYVHDRGYIIRDANGKPLRMVGAMRDITEEKLFAIERDKITSELIQRNKDLEQFAYIISHNLRTPVTNILGLSNILRQEGLAEQDREKCMDGLVLSVQKLDEVVYDLNHILQVRREINEKKEVVRFQDLVNDINTTINNLIQKENVQIHTNFDDADEIFTLKSYIHSIFYNLISNSIKYRLPGVNPVITISSRRLENKICLTFKDNGMGIDLDKHGSKIFGLYKKFHIQSEGKGMGLYMVKTQVEMLGGKIEVDSSVNKGAEFFIEFASVMEMEKLGMSA